jgi:hypothetical protein
MAVGDDAGSPCTVTVTASDGTVSASQTFTWAVNHLALANPGPVSSVDSQTV